MHPSGTPALPPGRGAGALLGIALLGLATAPCARGAEIAAYFDGGMPVASIPAADLDDLIYAFAEPNDQDLCASPTPVQRQIFAELRHRVFVL